MKQLVSAVALVALMSSVWETFAEDPVCVDAKNGQCQFVESSSESGSSALFYSVMGSVAVALTGIVPLIWIPSVGEEKSEDTVFMNRALSFAAGALLGDVFLHILPESLNTATGEVADYQRHVVNNGILMLVGIITFFTLEKVMSSTEDEDETTPEANGHAGGNEPATVPDRDQENPEARIQAAGYLNLIANCLDNFTHGLAIGGSFLVSHKFGLMTTGAILLHEIPHEFGDFAILLRAGFGRWRAAQLQICTATGGLFGALFAHLIDSRSVWWILPFTAGGFLHIALCTIIPDLIKDRNSKAESLFQLSILIFGVVVMGIVGCLE